ncbi:MAG: pyridoxamine 5'-phosphate oxidase family protein [Pseudomonadales bacterium]|nr:pyridoxamine 5'-phosphate oxidase family protein [Pseudomonadales bacterium]
MAKQFPKLEQSHIEFIGNQHVFFVGTAAENGYVNVSPKGMDSLRVISESKIVWLNLTGSGNESAAHVLENNRMTIMFCSFDLKPLIFRVYGSARAIHQRDDEWDELIGLFPAYVGTRQLFVVDISMVQTSCGFAVPFMEHKKERPTLENWATKNGREGVEDYWEKENTHSLDGKETGIFK